MTNGPKFINVADLPNPDDPQRRSYRECNRDLRHALPVGTLVEVVPLDDSEPSNAGVRLFVARHDRDCDQTPLYALGVYETGYDYERKEYFRIAEGGWRRGGEGGVGWRR